MKKLCLALMFVILTSGLLQAAQEQSAPDILQTAGGDLQITMLGHASLMFAFNGKIIHVDPFSKVAEYSILPKADLILLTHEHYDHLDLKALVAVRTADTGMILTSTCASQISGTVMKNGDVRTVDGVKIEAVPAYNLVHKRDDGQSFHPPGRGNGYILTFADKRVYVAGDTENIPEMKNLTGIDCAFLPMNLPYTMTPEMVVDAVKAFQPKIS